MIVFFDFVYKAHPKYLNEAVEIMRNVNHCCFFRHGDFDSWVVELRRLLKETTGGRYEKGYVRLLRTNNQIQIETKHGMDYAARINYTTVNKSLTQRVIGGEFVWQYGLYPDGSIVIHKEDE